jgi:HSP20 family molecular chaperone IbpA
VEYHPYHIEKIGGRNNKMNNSQDNETHQSDWHQFDQFFAAFPFGKPDKMNNAKLDLSWVETYVRDVIKRAGSQSPIKQNQDLHYEVFETHLYVIAKISLSEAIQPSSLKLLIGTNQIKIAGLPNNGTQLIPLPSPVNYKKSRTMFKQGVLQIKMRKRYTDENFQEVYVK